MISEKQINESDKWITALRRCLEFDENYILRPTEIEDILILLTLIPKACISQERAAEDRSIAAALETENRKLTGEVRFYRRVATEFCDRTDISIGDLDGLTVGEIKSKINKAVS